jgi:hypothetical protein
VNSSQIQRCIQIAQTVMPEKKSGKYFHVTFLLRKGKILVWAANDYTKAHLSSRFGDYKPTKTGGSYNACLHSEVAAVRTFTNKFRNTDMRKITLFNVRLDHNGKPCFAAPCVNCQRNIVDPLNFKEVEFTK